MAKLEKYTILILMNATPAWLSLSREARGEFFEKEVMPVFMKVGESVSVKLYDSEYFHGRVSDYLIVETTDLYQYKYMMEMLRDTKIYGVPYFDIVDIIPGQENAFREFDEMLKNQ